ncbi:DUF1365 domain-containing protein [Leptospira sp. 96542]|nr:DUF1365 domain-containing protein [Leptospira sp. 96542]
MYKADVFHTRTFPKQNHFHYQIFNFYLDLEEIDQLVKLSAFFSRNKWNLFSFYDKDHLFFGKNNVYENVKCFLRESGVQEPIGKVFLLTNLRILGYVFNPVSFYFCYSENGKLICSIPEVGNTFGEIRPYIGLPFEKNIGTIASPEVHLEVKKEFYVSPFIGLESYFDFRLNAPNDKLQIGVDSYEDGKRTLTTSFIGKKISFSNKNLLKLFAQFPFVTVKIIVLIHYQAFKLWVKKIPYIKKHQNLENQTGVSLGKASKPISLAKNI